MKILIDRNLSPSLAGFFAAAANGFVIFTHDLDFGALLADRESRQPSVIQIRTQDALPAAIRSSCAP